MKRFINVLCIFGCVLSLVNCYKQGNIEESRNNVSAGSTRCVEPVFKMDNFTVCLEKKGLYCKANIKLAQEEFTSKDVEVDENYPSLIYTRNVFHRAICVPNEHRENVGKYLDENVQTTFGSKQIESTEFVCSQDHVMTVREKIIKLLLNSYYALVFFSTVIDVLMRKINTNTNNIVYKLIQIFSLKANFKNAGSPRNQSEHVEKLKSLDGIRTFNCSMIIWLHIRNSYTAMYVSNTDYIENVYQYKLVYLLFILDMLLIQTFLLLSAWMMTVKVYDVLRKTGEFSLLSLVILFLNRIFRFWPVLTFFYVLQKKAYIEEYMKTPHFDMMDTNENACQKYWWSLFLFFNNYFTVKNMCIPMAWYLSVDVQLYLLAMLLLYVMFKFKFKPTIYFGTLIAVSYCINALIIYWFDLDVSFKFVPETNLFENVVNSSDIKMMYQGTHVNVTTYIIGTCFGIVYYENKNNPKFFIRKVYNQVLWALLFIGLPCLSVVLSSYKYKGLSSALLGPLLKPLYVTGIGIGILGMSYNVGGIIKKICEWPPILFLSKFTFCTYLFHFIVVYYKTIISQTPMVLSHTALITSLILEVPISFFVGFFVYLLVEVPGSKIQQLLLPKIDRSTKKTK